MKLKLDENLPEDLVPVLIALNHDVDTVRGENLTGHPDESVWRETQNSERMLVTQDLDFSDIRKFVPGTHFGLMLVRLRNPSRKSLAERVAAICRDHRLDDWEGCFVIATDNKVRVRRP